MDRDRLARIRAGTQMLQLDTGRIMRGGDSYNSTEAMRKIISLCDTTMEVLDSIEQNTAANFMWNRGLLQHWTIVGMNHYFADCKRYLFVAMEKDGQCIKAEGEDEYAVFASLYDQAEEMVRRAGTLA